MNIRPGNPGDAKAVASLIASFRPILTLDPSGAGAEHYLASVSEDAERQYLDSPRYAYLIAELEERMAGFIAMRDSKHLFHLFVAAAHQRTGIARALWEQARQLSLRAGPIAEFTVNSSPNAVPVYRSFGFVPIGTVMQAHGIAFLPMRLTLHNMLKKNRSAPNTAVIPVLYYPDAREAVEWLTTALPFAKRLRNSDTRFQLVHGNGAIVVTQPGAHANGALSTQQNPAAHSITLRVMAIDELFGRAKAAGARVLAVPEDQMYGERQCSFLDPWGHPWTLSETIFDSDPADWGGELLAE